jgi:hypothetical protein
MADVTLLEVAKEVILAMSEAELVEFAWDKLGIALDPTWPKNRLLYRLLGFATQVIEY